MEGIHWIFSFQGADETNRPTDSSQPPFPILDLDLRSEIPEKFFAGLKPFGKRGHFFSKGMPVDRKDPDLVDPLSPDDPPNNLPMPLMRRIEGTSEESNPF
jgi:hypothetical protein